ncbi:MAG: site-2 protease family protein [Myxococcota bacterium]
MFSFDHMTVLFIAAWFVQMGAHEGAHAYVADWCGDDTAHLQGKRSFNPFAHIDVNSPSSLIFAVGAPVVTALMGLIPMGMAWVPVTPRKLKGWRRDLALVSIAGPAANFAVAALCLPVHMTLSAVGDAPGGVLQVLDDLSYAVFLTSLVYGIFNLIPIPPLDGSKVLHYFLGPWGRGVMDQLQPYGMFILVAVFMGGPGSGIIHTPLQWAMQLWVWAGLVLL